MKYFPIVNYCPVQKTGTDQMCGGVLERRWFVLRRGSELDPSTGLLKWRSAADGFFSTKYAYTLIQSCFKENRELCEPSSRKPMRQFWRKLRSAVLPRKIKLYVFLSEKMEPESFRTAPSLMWFMWYNRYLQWHDNDGLEVSTIVLKVESFLKHFSSCNSVYQTEPQHGDLFWRPPRQGLLKINCDGAWMEGGADAGLGVVIRDQEGSVIAAHSIADSSIDNCLDAEGLALKHGMSLAKSLGLGLEKLLFETDITTVAGATALRSCQPIKNGKLI